MGDWNYKPFFHIQQFVTIMTATLIAYQTRLNTSVVAHQTIFTFIFLCCSLKKSIFFIFVLLYVALDSVYIFWTMISYLFWQDDNTLLMHPCTYIFFVVNLVY